MTPQLVGSILVGADEAIAEMVAGKIVHVRSFGPCTSLGIVRAGTLIGGVVYHGYLGHDVQMSCWLQCTCLSGSGVLRAIFAYPFHELNCVRVTAITGRKNRKSRRLIERLGFKLEGVHPKGLDGFDDAFSFGMLRQNCRWIKDQRYGLERTNAAAAA